MAERLKLAVGATEIEISPLPGWNIPKATGREMVGVKNGYMDFHKYGSQEAYEIPINDISDTDADQIHTWWENMTTITFTPDLQGAPGTTVEMKIDGFERPLQMWNGNYDDKYAGVIYLYGISSTSFSSISESVSASQSCSTSVSTSCYSSWSAGGIVNTWEYDVLSSLSWSWSYSGIASTSVSLSEGSKSSWSSSWSCSTSSSWSCSIYYDSSSSSGYGWVRMKSSSCEFKSGSSCGYVSSLGSSMSSGWTSLVSLGSSLGSRSVFSYSTSSTLIQSSVSGSMYSTCGELSSVSCSQSGVG